MAYAIGPLKFTPEDRLYESVRVLCTIVASIVYTAMVLRSGAAPSNRVGIFRSKPFKLDLHLPGVGPMELSIQNRKPNSIQVNLTASSAIPLPDDSGDP